MEKNNKSETEEFIGVEEKYIPESAKTSSTSQKKPGSLNKGPLIAIIVVVVVALIVGMFYLVGTIKVMNSVKSMIGLDLNQNTSVSIISSIIKGLENMGIGEGENIFDGINERTSEIEKTNFNNSLEFMSGTQSHLLVEKLLDEAVLKIKKTDHEITVTYGQLSSNIPDGIVDIKHSLEDGKKYEVSLDYDKDGYINKITITDLP